MYVVRTDVGRKRETNEDYFLIKKLDENTDLYIVADGLGGYESGEVASRIACETVYDNLLLELDNLNKSKNKSRYITMLLKNSVSLANKKIFDMEKTDPKYKGMGTTLIVVFRYLSDIYYISVGDSRIYYIDRDKKNIDRITEDDTYVNSLIKSHAITYEESKNHPQKHVLTKAIGVFETITVDVSKLEENLDGYLLLCTDGVTNMLNKHEILNIFKNNEFDIIAQKIIEESNSKGGTDNITALVIDIKV